MICLIIEDKFYTDKLIIKFKVPSSKFKGKKVQRKKSSKENEKICI